MQNLQSQASEYKHQSQRVVLSDRELSRVSNYIGGAVGIQLPASKQSLVESRLRKRLVLLGFEDFKSYLDFTLDSSKGKDEKMHLIDAMTTNKTDFYRESEDFEFLIQKALPELINQRGYINRRELNLWCAGCSTGEEAYTLSIELNEYAEKHRDFMFNIMATDISDTCVSKGRSGIYTERQVEPVALNLRKKYLLRSSNKENALVQMGSELKRRVQFNSLNLMDKYFNLDTKMEIIFCRNVMVYFNNQVRQELVEKFEDQLVSGGYLFVGHSESLSSINTSLKQVAPMVYKKT